MGRFGSVLAGVTLAGLIAAAQTPSPQPTPATGLIIGQVVDSESGRPVSESVVTLVPISTQPQSPLTQLATAQKVITDANGRFAYRNLPRAQYSITTVKPGYLTGVHGKVVPRGPSSRLELADGERVIDVRILMWKHAAITGRVVDEAGEPMVGIEMRVRHVSTNAGRPGFRSFLANPILTDDRGFYRVPGLEPGSYVVGVAATSTTVPAQMVEEYFRATGLARAELAQGVATAAPLLTAPGSTANQVIGDHVLQVEGRMPTPPASRLGESPAVYTAVYYPQAARISDAATITVKAGETRPGVNLELRSVRSAGVSGRLEGPPESLGAAALFLLPTSAGEPTADLSEAAATTVSDASGAFTFLGVPAGQYLLFVMKMPGPSTPGLSFWAQRTLAVGEANIANLPVVMQRGLRIAGSVTYDGAGQAKPAGRLTPFVESIAQWARSLSPEVMVAPDGRFSFPGFIAGRYLLTLPLPSGWYVKSAISAGRDVADLPFELTEDMTDVVVTVSDRGARVSGNVRDRTSKPDADARVITFPVDPRYWVDFSAYARRIREVVTDRDGAFVLSDLPPGDYFVVAASQAAIDWSVPRLLERLSAVATRVTLAEGERKSVDLQRAQVK